MNNKLISIAFLIIFLNLCFCNNLRNKDTTENESIKSYVSIHMDEGYDDYDENYYNYDDFEEENE